MKKRITGSKRKQESIQEPEPEESSIQKLIRTGMMEFVMQAGIESVIGLIEEEITACCGERYRNLVGRVCSRWGFTESPLVMGGKKVMVKRGRVRDLATRREVQLETIAALKDTDLLAERQLEQMLVGVSTRKCHRSLEAMPSDVRTFSDSKSSVSRRFVLKTTRMLQERLYRKIKDEYPILLIDGTVFKETTIIIALGIRKDGEKCVLGFWNGSTENSAVCTDLLADLVERGLAAEKVRLAVLDGGKAIRKAVNAVFGEKLLVQRCQFHKVENVMGYLTEEMKPSVKRAMQEAYATKDYDTALRLLGNLAKMLVKDNVQAAQSLEEGLAETLTLHRIGIDGALRRSLSTTNLIENLNSRIKGHTVRIRRWKNPNMVLRWVLTGICEAEKGFRRIKGYKGIENLVWLIDHGQNADGNPLDKDKAVA